MSSPLSWPRRSLVGDLPPAVAPGCDAPEPRPLYLDRIDDGVPVYRCRCIVCDRCGKHTGNSTQGHYWGWCKKRGAAYAHHFCCPGDCEHDAGQRSLIPPVHPDMAGLVPAHLPRVGRASVGDM
jgi:hypothetical protein